MTRRERIAGRALAAAYLAAKRAVLDAGYEAEVAWQEYACDAPLTERRFLREAAWVVLNAGMRESVVRRLFPQISGAFGDFVDARTTSACARDGGREVALDLFGHTGKIDAIITIAFHVEEHGLDEVRDRLAVDGVPSLQRFPYVGPVTAFHLAKNLGHDVAKPDRHLTRIAHVCGHSDPQALCRHVFDLLGEPVPVVDLVLWRFATLSCDYLSELIEAATTSASTSSWPGPAHPPLSRPTGAWLEPAEPSVPAMPAWAPPRCRT